VVMFELDDGLILALYPRTELAKDANVPLGEPKTGEFSIGRPTSRPAMGDLLRLFPRISGLPWCSWMV